MICVVNKYKHIPTMNQDFYIGRGSALGNPFTHKDLSKTKAEFQCATREETIEAYEPYIRKKIAEKVPEVVDALRHIQRIEQQYGRVYLVCFCSPQSCHGDIIKKILLEGVI